MRRCVGLGAVVLFVVSALGCAAEPGGDHAAGSQVGGTSRVVPVAPVTPVPPWGHLERTAVLDELGVADLAAVPARVELSTGFETLDDFAGWYATPQSETTRHELSDEQVHGGQRSHKGWLTGVAPTTPERDGPNHRGYPTVQLAARPQGGCASPCLVRMWVWLDAELGPGEWFSLATYTADPTDRWAPVITVNVGSEGWLHTFHVPRHGEASRAFQTDRAFPRRQWVEVTTYLDFRAAGSVVVWEDGKLASAARVEGGAVEGRTGRLEQAHFGLYTPPELLQGTVFNDDLTIWSLAT